MSLSRLENTKTRVSKRNVNMRMIEDYPGPTEDQPEKQGVEFPADEGIVKPPVTPEEEGER